MTVLLAQKRRLGPGAIGCHHGGNLHWNTAAVAQPSRSDAQHHPQTSRQSKFGTAVLSHWTAHPTRRRRQTAPAGAEHHHGQFGNAVTIVAPEVASCYEASEVPMPQLESDVCYATSWKNFHPLPSTAHSP